MDGWQSLKSKHIGEVTEDGFPFWIKSDTKLKVNNTFDMCSGGESYDLIKKKRDWTNLQRRCQ
jgi:hypothetical protein